jgi:SAM-dependent methyltransferase
VIPRMLAERIRCPACRGALVASQPERADDGTALSCTSCRTAYPVRRGIPRFVPAENYASNFGFQWNRFKRTQLDSYTGHPISRNRFLTQVALTLEELRGLIVLDVGCGAGRFAEIVLEAGATVIGVDYSSAIDAAADNLSRFGRFHPVQADISSLPFVPRSFDLVYCLGVLQHTPDVHRAFRGLAEQVTPGGRLVVDVYPRRWRNRVHPKYLLRPMTRRMDQQRLFGVIERVAPVLLRVSRAVGRLPVAGSHLRKLVPVANYEGVLPLSPTQLEEWAVLDTFDWLAPRHDQPQTARAVKAWFEDAGLEEVQVVMAHHLTGRGRAPARSGRHGSPPS